MIINLKNRYEKKEYDVIREAAKYLHYLQLKLINISEKILCPQQTRVIEQGTFTNFPFGEKQAFEKQTKTIKHCREKQAKILNDQGKTSLYFKIFKFPGKKTSSICY